MHQLQRVVGRALFAVACFFGVFLLGPLWQWNIERGVNRQKSSGLPYRQSLTYLLGDRARGASFLIP